MTFAFLQSVYIHFLIYIMPLHITSTVSILSQIVVSRSILSLNIESTHEGMEAVLIAQLILQCFIGLPH